MRRWGHRRIFFILVIAPHYSAGDARRTRPTNGEGVACSVSGFAAIPKRSPAKSAKAVAAVTMTPIVFPCFERGFFGAMIFWRSLYVTKNQRHVCPTAESATAVAAMPTARTPDLARCLDPGFDRREISLNPSRKYRPLPGMIERHRANQN